MELRETLIAICNAGAASEPQRSEEFRKLQRQASAFALESTARAAHESGVGFRLRVLGRMGLGAITLGTLCQILGVLQ